MVKNHVPEIGLIYRDLSSRIRSRTSQNWTEIFNVNGREQSRSTEWFSSDHKYKLKTHFRYGYLDFGPKIKQFYLFSTKNYPKMFT